MPWSNFRKTRFFTLLLFISSLFRLPFSFPLPFPVPSPILPFLCLSASLSVTYTAACTWWSGPKCLPSRRRRWTQAAVLAAWQAVWKVLLACLSDGHTVGETRTYYVTLGAHFRSEAGSWITCCMLTLFPSRDSFFSSLFICPKSSKRVWGSAVSSPACLRRGPSRSWILCIVAVAFGISCQQF